jgi:hypothetical protein
MASELGSGALASVASLLQGVSRTRALAALLVALYVHGRLSGDALVRVVKGRALVQLPLVVYDVVAALLAPLNWAINATPLVHSAKWDSDPLLSPAAVAKAPEALGQEALAALRKRIVSRSDVLYSEPELVQLFDSLPPAPCELVIGKTYKGMVLRSLSTLDLASWFVVKPFQMLGFNWGKRYRSKFVGDPLLVNWMDCVFFPLPAWGNVTVYSMDYRGKEQATMNYDHQPWRDFFRVLDDGRDSGKLVLLGVWCARDTNGGWFTLQHEPEIPA